VAVCDTAPTDPTPDARSAVLRKTGQVALDQGPVPMDMSAWNARIAETGFDVALAQFEDLTTTASDQVGAPRVRERSREQAAPVGLGSQRPRNRTGRDIVYLVNPAKFATATGLPATETVPAVQRAMQARDEIQCSNPPIVFGGATPTDYGVVQTLLGSRTWAGSPWTSSISSLLVGVTSFSA